MDRKKLYAMGKGTPLLFKMSLAKVAKVKAALIIFRLFRTC